MNFCYYVILSYFGGYFAWMFAGIFIPQILLVAFKKDLFDMPDERKIHKGIVPRLEASVLPCDMFLPYGHSLGITMLCWRLQAHVACRGADSSLSMGFLPLFLMYIVGVGDDLVGVRYRAKFVASRYFVPYLSSGGRLLD